MMDYLWRDCEVCLKDVRSTLVRFADNSVFALCMDCVTDLVNVVEVFDIECSLESIPVTR